MRETNNILSSLATKGVKIWIDHGEMCVRAPKGLLLPEDLDRLRLRKAEIVEFLKDSQLNMDLPLRPRAADCPIPLTALQLRAWNQTLGQKGLSTRTCAIAARVTGPLNICLLREGIEHVACRHESLRTRVVSENGTILQRIDTDYECSLETVDLTKVPQKDIDAEVMRISMAFIDEKVDLSVGPLFSAILLALPGFEHLLVLSMDHIVSDAVSMQILNRDIWNSYHELERGMPTSVSDLPVQFADYAVWQQQTYGTWINKHEGYWRGRLTGAPQVELPPRDCQIEVDKLVGERLEIPFGESLSAQLREVARRERTLPALVVLTVYVAVMSRWCNTTDLLLMFVSNGRYRQELDDMIGFISNILHLRIAVPKGERFIDLLKRVTCEYFSAYDHQDFGRVPDLFPECYTELGFNWASDEWVQFTVARSDSDESQVSVKSHLFKKIDPAKFYCYFIDAAAGITCKVEYRPDLFSRSTIKHFVDNLLLCARQLTECPMSRP